MVYSAPPLMISRATQIPSQSATALTRIV